VADDEVSKEEQIINKVISVEKKVTFPFEVFFEKYAYYFSINHLSALTDNDMLFSKLRAKHFPELSRLFSISSHQSSEVLNKIFQKTLQTKMNFDLTAYILSNQELSRFLNIPSLNALQVFQLPSSSSPSCRWRRKQATMPN
jgi:hypothetical protein